MINWIVSLLATVAYFLLTDGLTDWKTVLAFLCAYLAGAGGAYQLIVGDG